MSSPRHLPVMVLEVLRYLEPRRGGLFVDCTLGLGGHAEAILEAGPTARLLGIDRDPQALALAGQRLARFGNRVELVEGCFGELHRIVDERGAGLAAGIVADLGLSSLQLDLGERGFSLKRDGPLDMRMGGDGRTAAEIVGEYEEEALRRIFNDYGEERMARRIARTIVETRDERPIETTRQLRELVHRAKGRAREGRIDASTRVFQALRIEVNQELAELERLLEEAVRYLDLDGRLVVISYHSLEDRPVKHTFRALSRGEQDRITGRTREETRLLELLTRRAVRPREDEIVDNPRARSARLRAARRIEQA